MAQTKAIDSEPLPPAVENLLAAKAGLRLGGAERAKAGAWLRARAERRFPNPAAYCASLGEKELAREVARLAAQLTPGETFFFRDHGQFDLLRLQLLPELIERRRREGILRLWSAGCASGEEAYSLAMLIDMLLPERGDWRIFIAGSDINRDALARAREGRYGAWSFRLLPERLKARYFRPVGQEWRLDERIRGMVEFRPGNLVDDPLPDATFRDMDLILCRNLLIYFHAEAVGAVAAKLSACLAAGGYLMTGHTELLGQHLPALRSRLFPEGVVYQRMAGAQLPAAPPPLSAAAPPTVAPPSPRRSVVPTSAAPLSIPPWPPSGTAKAAPAAPLASLAAARALADRGDYAGAEAACRQALAADPLQPAPHFLLAQLAQLRGDYPAAEAQLKETLYLAPGHVAAWLELAALDERAGASGRAQARRRAALDLVRRLPAEERVEPFEASAGELADWLLASGAG